jgi:hypothetical protein
MTETIKMLERRFSHFPARFSWRGRVHQVEAVNECKTVTNPWDDKTVYHFWVRCNGQQVHLSEVSPSGDWILHSD